MKTCNYAYQKNLNVWMHIEKALEEVDTRKESDISVRNGSNKMSCMKILQKVSGLGRKLFKTLSSVSQDGCAAGTNVSLGCEFV